MRILVTGGTGSLGRALLHYLKDSNIKADIIIFSRDETKQGKVRAQFPEHTYVLGDVAKYRDVERVMGGVDLVFHFAAYKQVPSAQNNVAATIETNVVGSQNVVDAAIKAGVKKVVASSTDKAAAPANAYGASKSLMESIFQNGNRNRFSKTTFHLARYGNVISSNASVIPLFQRQAANGGPITVTDARMTRFWITVDRAVQLVLKALVQRPGVIVVPKAPAMSIMDVARAIADKAAYSTRTSIPEVPIIETGIRPGEKIHEIMVTEAESFYTRGDDRHFYIYPPDAEYRNPDIQWPFTYASNAPVRLLTAGELLQMIRETHEKYDI